MNISAWLQETFCPQGMKDVWEYRSLRPKKKFDVQFLASAPEKMILDGRIIYLNPRDTFVSSWIAFHHEYEPETTRVFSELLNENSIAVDVGANIGWYTLLAADRSSKVYAFEPDPLNFSLLSKSIAANEFRNVICFGVAISDKVGTDILNLSKTNFGSHSLVRFQGGGEIQVRTTTLDQCFPEEVIDVLKIDVEGAETKVIRGAKKILESRRVRHIIIEGNKDHLTKILDLPEEYEAKQIKSKYRNPNTLFSLRP